MSRLIFILLVLPLHVASQYLGGSTGGYQQKNLFQSNCAHFYGGAGAGFESKRKDIPFQCSMFYGGERSGYGQYFDSLTTNCLMFAGGVGVGSHTSFYISPYSCLFYRSSENLGKGDDTRRRSEFEEVCVALPLSNDLSPLTGVVSGKNGYLNWETYVDQFIVHFDVQVSVDGANWKNIGKVISQGPSFAALNYQFIDYNLGVTTQYYRIKVNYRDGDFVYSNIVALSLASGKGNKDIFAVYPNPAIVGQRIMIKSWLSNDWSIRIRLEDLFGRIVVSSSHNFKKGNDSISLNTTGLVAGTYVVILENEKDFKSLKLPLVIIN